jgi:hypothetical protein
MISFLISAVLMAQQVSAPPPVKAHVEGRVVNSLNGEAVRKATVVLRARDEAHGQSFADETDVSGRFSMDDVEPGEYAAVADRLGYIFESRGATGAPPPNLKVDKGEQIKNFIIRLTPVAVITGRVLDADGDPVPNASVRALRLQYVAGNRGLRGFQQVQTNDEGEYRLFGLRAGTFYLRASRNQQGLALPESLFTYYPGTTDEHHAAPIEVSAGTQLTGIDVRLQSANLFSIRIPLPEGYATDPRNYPAFLLNDQGFTGREANASGAGIAFDRVPPGSYHVLAFTSDDDKLLFARQSVEVVNSDINAGPLSFAPGSDISGTVRVEGVPSRSVEGVTINLLPVERFPFFGQPDTRVAANGSFQFKNLIPGVYRLVMGRLTGMYLKSLRAGDKQLPDLRLDARTQPGPLTVLLGADAGQVEGSVYSSKGEAAVRARVDLIPSGDHASRVDFNRSNFSDERGEFSIQEVPPGEYQVFAWEDVPVGAPQDPEFRKPFEKRAAALKVEPNGHAKVTLTAIPAIRDDR